MYLIPRVRHSNRQRVAGPFRRPGDLRDHQARYRRLRHELLEDRRMLAPLPMITIDDVQQAGSIDGAQRRQVNRGLRN